METIEEIEESLKARCSVCEGMGKRKGIPYSDRPPWCAQCFGTGLKEYEDLDGADTLVVKLFDIARVKTAAGEEVPWKISMSCLK